MIRVLLLSILAGLSTPGDVSAGAQDAAESTEEVTPESAVRDVIGRLIPAHADAFAIEFIPPDGQKDVFEYDGADGRVVLRGSSVPSLLAGLNWYLKYECNCHVSWTGDQLRLPDKLPMPARKVRRASPFRYRYIYNYCTFSYTMAFWNWPRWERELDFLALNGINLPLAAVVGQEAVWQAVMRRLRLGENHISEFVPSPAFSAWWAMGNLEGWGGPVSQSLIIGRAAIQGRIVARMRELGMEPVLQGFYGMVPRSMIERFPGAKIHETGQWCGFERPAMLDPNDPFFVRVAKIWYDKQQALYGDAKFYGGDPFHEGGNADIDLTGAGKAIQKAMLDANPDASWVLQAWQGNPKPELLAQTRKDRTLILDLFGESDPQWRKRNGFDGHPWAWCVISNFGGNVGMYGAAEKVAIHPIEAINDAARGNLVGIGGLPEGTETNAAFWDLLFEMPWRTEPPNLDTWFGRYAGRRYGKSTPGVQQAWSILKDTVYGARQGSAGEPQSVFCARPALRAPQARAWGSLARAYDQREFARAWSLLVAEADGFKTVDTFSHDLVDVTRQALANLGVMYHRNMADAFEAGDAAAFDKHSRAFLELILDQDQLLATDHHFIVGNWLRESRSWASKEEGQDRLESSARALITTWGPRGPASTLRDYANREWSGLLSGFYHPRWKRFVDELKERLNGRAPREIDWYAMEEQWTLEHDTFSSSPIGEPIAQAKRLHAKYASMCAGLPAPAEITKDKVRGIWQYPAHGKTYRREFRDDGAVLLYENGQPSRAWSGYRWRIADNILIIASPDSRTQLQHQLQSDGTLLFLNEPWGWARRVER